MISNYFEDQTHATVVIGKAVGMMDNELGTMDRLVNGLVATWDADAKEAYLPRQKAWTDASNNIKEAMALLKTTVGTVKDKGVETEGRNVKTVAGG